MSGNIQKVKWVGKQLPPVELKWLEKRDVAFYKRCFCGPLSISIGDFVLIQNLDAPEPDTIDGCEIARIEHLYEILDTFENYPYRAAVKWYSRFGSTIPKALRNINMEIDYNREVIEEQRPFDREVIVNCIFQKCNVIFASADDHIDDVIRRIKNKRAGAFPTFICRFKYGKIGRSFRLQPRQLSPEQNVEEEDEVQVMKNSGGERRGSLRSSTDNAIPASPTVKQLKYQEEKCNENKVSPIKIVRGCIVKVSRQMFSSDSPLSQQNSRAAKKTSRVAAARRNLNESFDNDAAAAEIDKSSDTPTKENKTPRKRAARYTSLCEDQYFIEVNEDHLTTPSRKRCISNADFDIYKTPTKKTAESVTTDTNKVTPSLRRRSILNSATKRLENENTPSHAKQLEVITEAITENITETPKRSYRRRTTVNRTASVETTKTPRRSAQATPNKKQTTPSLTPTQKMKLIRAGELSPALQQRTPNSSKVRKTDLQLAREVLHVSAVPDSLPCRENEFENIYTFIEGKIMDQCGGCMYISGVPGTGKTATVNAVIRKLKQQVEDAELPTFEYIEINGMRLTEPRQAYVQIFKQLTGKTVTWEHAQSLLDKRFTTAAPRRVTTVLLVDELDVLCNRRQDVVYNLLDWPTKSAARLVVITIANTMDLPERLLIGKVTSRLGLTRLTFQPYNYKHLQEIVLARLAKFKAFKGEAVQLVARKVAAVSGDARRALDICRRATEIAEVSKNVNAATDMDTDTGKFVTMVDVQQALNEMIASPKVQAIRNCSRQEQYFLRAVAAEVARTGVEEVRFLGVFAQLESICAFEGTREPTPTQALFVCAKLGSERLIISEHSRNDIFQRILLNVSADDIHYALRVDSSKDI